MRSVAATACLVATLLTACRTYVPLTTEAVPGSRVRLVLTDRGSVDVASQVGPRVEAIDGRVVSADGSSMTLAVSAVQLRGGLDNLWNGEPVTVPRSAIAAVREERISRSRTTLALTVLAVGGILLAVVIGDSYGGGGGTVPPPPPQ